MTAEQLLSLEFATLADLVHVRALERPSRCALIEGDRRLDYAGLDALMDRIAAALQREGVVSGDTVAICAATSIEYAAVFLGILRAGGVVVPLAPSSTPDSLAMMLKDCGAKLLFQDAEVARALATLASRPSCACVAIDGSAAGEPFERWLAPEGTGPAPVAVEPSQGFNIIYSSGTTGTPKGIVQPHRMRWRQIAGSTYPPDGVTLLATPLYSNTTLVSFLPTMGFGGTVVLLAKFDAAQFLKLSQQHRVTHTMLVPVQYRRLMQHPDFDTFDLSSYQAKFVTSAPFAAELKREVVRRWPGALTEYYGMTEGGGSCMLLAHEFPAKLHTVGQPMPDHDIRLIDEQGREVAQGEVGEIVGRSPAMMVGYHNQPEKTRDSEWYSPEGARYIRTGDVGRFDEDGFLTLLDRKKDMIISGGFNIYPSDLEAQINQHPDVLESAVVGVASERWGETPAAFVVLRPGRTMERDALLAWVNARLGKTQRLVDVSIVAELPRSHIGKVLKRALRDSYQARAG